MRWAADAVSNPAIGKDGSIAVHILWAGGLAHDVSDEAMRDAWRDTRVHVAIGERDRFASAASQDAMLARLAQMRVAPEVHRFDGGHRLDTQLLRTLLREMPGD
jgi:hypothetical protein